MQKLYFQLLGSALLAAGMLWGKTVSAQTPFTPGRLVVLQAGDGTAALSNSGNAIFLKEYLRSATVQAAPTNTVAVPASGAGRLVLSGTATTEGLITLSADSAHLVIAGYDTSATNTVALPGSTSASINRAVDTVGIYGVPGRAVNTTAFSGNNIRQAVKSTNDNYWAVGGNGGVQYLGNTAAATALGTTVTNIRAVQIAGGNLYFSSTTGTNPGVVKITGMPTVSGTGAGTLLFTTGASSQPGDFAINASETVVYVADGRTGAGGGIQKWVFAGGSWTAADTLVVGAAARSLAVDWSTAFPMLYATTSDNRLVAVIDSNYAPGYTNTYVTIATAPTGTAFRGVAFTPKPAIACTAPMLAATITHATCTAGGGISLTVMGGSPVSSFFWTGPGNFMATTQNISNVNPGTYTLTATAIGGCTTSSTFAITTTPGVAALVSAISDTTFCQGDGVLLVANASNGFAYEWLVDGIVITGATGPSFAAHLSGNYALILTDHNGCRDTSAAIRVTAKPLPTPRIAYSGGQLTVQNAGAYSNFKWYLNNGTTPVATSAAFAPVSNGSYTLRADSNGCNGISNTIAVSDLSVISMAENPFAVYPNPAQDAIEILPAGQYHVRITDIQGRTVMQLEDTHRIRIDALTNGLYLLHIRTQNGVEAAPVKLLKQ